MLFKYADSAIEGTKLAADLAPYIAGKTILITGVSPNSLGAAYAQTVSHHKPALLILAGRNLAKVQVTVDAIKAKVPGANLRILELDLISQKAVRKSAEVVNGWADVAKIDVLVLNAAIMAQPYAKTVDGIEAQFGTNHIGHFLFANLIINKVLAAPAPRIVSVASMGHLASPVRFFDIDFQDGKYYDEWVAYGQAKTANILFARGLASRLGSRGVLAVSLHPGGIKTNLGAHLDETFNGFYNMLYRTGYPTDNISMINHNQGHANHILCSFSPEVTKEYNGVYFDKLRPADQRKAELFPWAKDDVEAERLWELSEKLVGQKFEY